MTDGKVYAHDETKLQRGNTVLNGNGSKDGSHHDKRSGAIHKGAHEKKQNINCKQEDKRRTQIVCCKFCHCLLDMQKDKYPAYYF